MITVTKKYNSIREVFLQRISKLGINEEDLNLDSIEHVPKEIKKLYLCCNEIKCNKCKRVLLAINFHDDYKICKRCKKKQKEHDLVMEVLLGMDI